MAFNIDNVFKVRFVRPDLSCLGDYKKPTQFKFAINACSIDFGWLGILFQIGKTSHYLTETDVNAEFNGKNLICSSNGVESENYTLPCEMVADSTPKGAKFPYFASISFKQSAENMNLSKCQVSMKIVSL